MLTKLKKEIEQGKDPKRAIFVSRYFKTGKGEYGEGDVFIGLTVPQSRSIAKKYAHLSLRDVLGLLHSPIHEERLIALFILVDKYKKGTLSGKKELYDIYLANTRYINNWDLIDSSADLIIGNYLIDTKQGITLLKKLAKSKDIWKKRISILSTWAYTKRNNSPKETCTIALLLLHDKHDLIQKAVGWMLREAGKRCGENGLDEFLRVHYKTMPRTMLRYAIEKFSQERRKQYLRGEVE